MITKKRPSALVPMSEYFEGETLAARLSSDGKYGEEDAALHRYLHQTTAQARALIEVALQRVAEAEGLEY